MPKTIVRAESGSIATDSCIFSAGEKFADGAMSELVSSSSGRNKPDLLLWDGNTAVVGPRVQHDGRIYEAPELPPSLYRATRLPSHCSDYVSARDLHAALTDLFRQHFHLPEREANLSACFPIGSSLADCLPIAPSLVISGCDEGLGIDLLRLLHSVCRHPLILAGLSPGSFRSLPLQLPLTLLLNQQELTPKLERLLRALSYRGLYLPGNRGGVIDRYGPKAIFCGNDAAIDQLGGGVLQIFLPPSQSQASVLDEQTLTEIANDFQPRLLMYRLKNVPKVREPQVDVSQFTFATRPLARTLAMCFPEDLELACEMIELLRPQDEEARGQCSRDVNYAIVEILLGYLHDRQQREVRVKELAKDVNALLRSRGEIIEHSPEELGRKLSNKLSIPRHPSSAGQQVLLNRDTSQSVHRLAQAYGLPCAEHPEASCPDCGAGENRQL